MTLPDRILERLAEIDVDRAKAVVKAVEATRGREKDGLKPVDKLTISPNESLLTVVHCRPLSTIPWLTTVEISPGRNLLSLHDGIPVEKLEVALQDLLDVPHGMSDADRRVLETLLERIRTPRRSQSVRTAQILVIQTTPTERRRKSRNPGGSARTRDASENA